MRSFFVCLKILCFCNFFLNCINEKQHCFGQSMIFCTLIPSSLCFAFSPFVLYKHFILLQWKSISFRYPILLWLISHAFVFVSYCRMLGMIGWALHGLVAEWLALMLSVSSSVQLPAIHWSPLGTSCFAFPILSLKKQVLGIVDLISG